MKYLPLVWAGLWRRPLRTALTFLSVVVAFLLFGILHGVSGGFDAAINAMSDARLRVQNRVSFTRWLPLSQRVQIERVPGVIGITEYAYFGGFYQDPKNQIGSGAMDMAGVFAVFPELEISQAERQAMLHTRPGALVGAELAKKFGWKVGDHIPISTPIWKRKDGGNWAVDIVGIYSFKNDALPANELWMNYDYVNEGRLGMDNQVSMYIVAIDNPVNAPRISQAIDALFRNSETPTLTQSEKDWIRTRIKRVGNIQFLVNAIIGAVLFTLLALTANTMMQSIRERIPEFAVLKTFGYPNGVIAWLVLAESLLLCVTAAAFGLAAAASVFPGMFSSLGVGAIPIPAEVVIAGFALAACVALVSSVLPVWQALRLNVVTALAAH
jgi:putative ABC transport system permease protein